MKEFFDAARVIAGGSLTQKQVNDLNLVIDYLTPKCGMKLDIKGLDLIKSFEGKRLRAYDDGVGVWTIGYGTTIYPNGVKVKRGDVITDAQANEYIKNDVKTFEAVVNKNVSVKLTQNQFNALVSLTYNIGGSAFANSTLLRKLNASDYKGAADQFLVWNKGGGRVMPGLVTRRKKEKAIFES